MLSIIIPAYNEEENIRRIDKELKSVLDLLGEEYEIIIINDGSNDRTKEEIIKLKEKDSKIKLLNHEKNKGMGMAVRNGIKAAKGEIIVTYEADFTWHPNYIKKLLEELRRTNSECVIGSHFHKQGAIEDWGRYNYKIILSKIVNLMYQFLLGKKITSISSLFRVYKANSLKKLELKTTGFDINAEILIKLLMNNSTVREVPVILTKRKYGESKIKLSIAIINHSVLLFNLIKWRVESIFRRK